MLIFYAFKWWIRDTEKTDGICLTTLVVDQFLGLFLHPSIFPTKHTRSA